MGGGFANCSRDAKFDPMKPEVVTAALADAASGQAVVKELKGWAQRQ